MKKQVLQRGEALKLARRLMKGSNDEGLVALATQIQDRLRRPMTDILKKVPGKTVADKARLCEVSRQAYYNWIRGLSRPTGKQAEKISLLTGIPVDDISASKGLLFSRRARETATS